MMAVLPNHLRHHKKGHPKQGMGRFAAGAIYRGVVTETYLPDDPRLVGKVDFAEDVNPGVLCDVMIVELRKRTILKRIPVLQKSGGLNDYELWVPKASTLSLGGELTVSAEGSGDPVTDMNNLDGDQVAVGFFANDLNQPFILGQLAHPNTNRKPSSLDATQFKTRRVVRGISTGVTTSGDVEMDLSNASDGTQDTSGAEVVNPAGGNVNVTLQALAAITITDGGTPDNTLLGSATLSDLNNALLEVQTAFTGLGLPVVSLTVFTGSATTSLAGLPLTGAPYLSTNLLTD